METQETSKSKETCKIDSFTSLFCDNCHNLLYPTRRIDTPAIIYMCKVCFLEKEYDAAKAPLFYSKSLAENQKMVRTNILPQSKWGFDISLKRICLSGVEYVQILDGNLQQTLIRDDIFNSPTIHTSKNAEAPKDTSLEDLAQDRFSAS